MSETTWTVGENRRNYPDAALTVIKGPSVLIYIDHDADLQAERALAERIARLLAEEDERIERVNLIASTNPCPDCWGTGQDYNRKGIGDCPACKGSGRATLPQEPDPR